MAIDSSNTQQSGNVGFEATNPAPAPVALPKVTHRTITIKRPPFTYLHLTLLSSDPTSTTPPIDILTARSYLTSALEQYLGITGSAIPVDFLKVDDMDVWIRVPREDSSKVSGALSQWTGKSGEVAWRIRGKTEWLGTLSAGDGSVLFNE